ncbi:YcxB family protein [Cellulosilyticum sp. I15G10I2]|uniref:YcxB family protein n=1 Tax=Cellulosilyticum sp. I15G10I2 TaxID=1892843 RepID=UPI00085C49F0|nr:YcxB family protein [Cellulosilyticum sp. I15G10I2]
MKYTFTYRTTAYDLWQLSMYSIYGSMIGICNIIFTVAMLLLGIRFWEDVNSFVKILLIVAVCLFTIIQPAAIYMRAKKQVSAVSHDTEIGFNDHGIHVKAGTQTSELKWRMVKGISKKPGMVVILLVTKHGFVLKDKVLGRQKEDLYNYIISKTKK